MQDIVKIAPAPRTGMFIMDNEILTAVQIKNRLFEWAHHLID